MAAFVRDDSCLSWLGWLGLTAGLVLGACGSSEWTDIRSADLPPGSARAPNTRRDGAPPSVVTDGGGMAGSPGGSADPARPGGSAPLPPDAAAAPDSATNGGPLDVRPASDGQPSDRGQLDRISPAPVDAGSASDVPWQGDPTCLPATNPDEIISSFEDGTLTSAPTALRGGTMWYVINVGPGATATLAVPTQPVRCGSQRYLRFAGTASATQTPIVRILLVPDPDDPFYDARAYKGVRFSLRAGVASRVRLKLSDRNTASSGGVCEICSDHFGADLDVPAEWTSFTLPFSRLAQTGIGDPQPAVATEALFGIELVVRALPVFELNIDDVSFFR